MKIALGSDHAGFKLKEKIKKNLIKKNIEFKDFGCFSQESCDYPDFAKPVANTVANGLYNLGILICGTGIGMAITANKVPRIRAALCINVKMAKLSREHNNANILCLGARHTNSKLAVRIVNTFFKTRFFGGRHLRRINKIDR